MNRMPKIVATMGPSTQDRETLTRLIRAGLDVARLNFSHGTYEDHAQRIQMLRDLSNELNKPITILQDLQGPKLRVGNLPGGAVEISPGEIIVLSSHPENARQDPRYAGRDIIPFDVPNLEKSVSPGNHILMDDGALEIEVVGTGPNSVEARVVIGGMLKSHKGVNLPRANLDIPGFTEKDRADLQFGMQSGVDVVAISFVRNAADVETVRQAAREFAHSLSPQAATIPPIIAKIELPEAVENMHEIIHAADGVMVARGDLGIEMSPESVPNIQKELIEIANRHAKIVITATQMLDSMIHNPRPTRAEASDVANAIFDGSDAVMLSGETAAGQYPVESVKMMDAIIREAESHYERWGHRMDFPDDVPQTDALSITRAARELAHDRDVSAIAVFTETGRTAMYMSKARPRVPILAFTPERRTYQRLGLYWGVTPFLVPFATTVEAMLAHVDTAILAASNLTPGEQVVLISGFPVGTMREPNFALLYTVGSGL
jgi:pyruvate kinase